MLEFSERSQKLRDKLLAFMDAHIYPNERVYHEQLEHQKTRWAIPPIMEELKAKARSEGLWNLFMPAHDGGLSNFDYAPLCEVMGRSPIAPEAFNCAAPDTGNMEVLLKYGTPEQKEKWLKPLLAGEIRSGFSMT